MGNAEQTFPPVDLRAQTPEAAEIREKLAKHIEDLAFHMRAGRVRAFNLEWTNEPMETHEDPYFKTFRASPFSDVRLTMEVESP
jgi:hypothetical protein